MSLHRDGGFEEFYRLNRALSRAVAPLHQNESTEVVQEPDQDASWAPPIGGLIGHPSVRKPWVDPKCGRQIVFAMAWECFGSHQAEQERVAGKGNVWSFPPRTVAENGWFDAKWYNAIHYNTIPYKTMLLSP